jgi:hypothetical protein
MVPVVESFAEDSVWGNDLSEEKFPEVGAQAGECASEEW